MDDVPKCMLHKLRPKKCVAFEGTHTGRRFLVCPVKGGVNYGVVQWVDAPWPIILQNCLNKLWGMFHEQNCGRVTEKLAYEKNLAKMKKHYDHVCNEYQKMVDDISKMFDWQDGVDKVDYQMEMKKKEEVEMELKMEKLRLANEQRCIMKTQSDIIQNTRKAMHEIKVDRDQLAEEKEFEKVVADLLNAGHGSKEKLEQIKAILKS